MSERQPTNPPSPCPECNGETIEFRGSGKASEYKVCSRWKELGHHTEDEVKAKLKVWKDAAWPPGRYGLRRQA